MHVQSPYPQRACSAGEVKRLTGTQGAFFYQECQVAGLADSPLPGSMANTEKP